MRRIRVIQSLLKNFLGPKSPYLKTRSFTYFIPAPPMRKNGYQEKELDTITDYLLDNDFDILSREIKVLNTERSSGVWIFFLLGAKTLKAQNLNLNIEGGQISEHNSSDIKLDPAIIHDEF